MNRNEVTFVLTMKLTQASQRAAVFVFLFLILSLPERTQIKQGIPLLPSVNKIKRLDDVNCQFAKSRSNTEFLLSIDIVTGMMCGKDLGKEGK